jgi:hypothetical protein
MIPENVQRFNAFAAHLFSLLYEEFPNPCDIGPDHFFEYADEVEGEKVWGEHDNQTVSSTVRWLHDEGYIRVTDYSNGLSLGVTLTQKGLSVLNATPDSLHPSETMGAKIKNALADGSKGLVSKVVEQALDIGIAYAKTKVGL